MPTGPLSLMLMVVLTSGLARFLIAALLKVAKPSAGITKDYSFEPTVSILLPCYNEGKTVYDTIESISNSNYPNEKFEIIARDDASVDESYEWMLKAQRDFTNIRIHVSRNPKNSGKALTVCNALKRSEAEIVLTIDSDCIFHPEAIRELVVCFADRKIGGVGGAVGVRNVNDNLLTKGQTFIYYQGFHLTKGLESWTKTVICISGCMFAVRRDLMMKIEPLIRDRQWFGIEDNVGEDRFLTHQIMLHGYGTIINPAAQVWTTVPNNFSALFKQQIRWQRSGVRDFFMTIRRLPEHVWKVHPNMLYGTLFPMLTFLVSTYVWVISPTALSEMWLVLPFSLVFFTAASAIYRLTAHKYNPEQEIANPLTLAGFAVWILAARFIQIVAMCTLDNQDWGTRAKESAAEQKPELVTMAERELEPEDIAVPVLN